MSYVSVTPPRSDELVESERKSSTGIRYRDCITLSHGPIDLVAFAATTEGCEKAGFAGDCKAGG